MNKQRLRDVHTVLCFAKGSMPAIEWQAWSTEVLTTLSTHHEARAIINDARKALFIVAGVIVDPIGWLEALPNLPPRASYDTILGQLHVKPDSDVYRAARDFVLPRIESSEAIHLATDPTFDRDEFISWWLDNDEIVNTTNARTTFQALIDIGCIVKDGRRCKVQRTRPSPDGFRYAVAAELRASGRTECSFAWIERASAAAIVWCVPPGYAQAILETAAPRNLWSRSYCAGNPRIVLNHRP